LKDEQILDRWLEGSAGFRKAKQIEAVKEMISLGHS